MSSNKRPKIEEPSPVFIKTEKKPKYWFKNMEFSENGKLIPTMSALNKILRRQRTKIRQSCCKGIRLLNTTCNNTVWKICIQIDDGIYHGMKFDVMLVFPRDYPFNPPNVAFLQYVYHPNVDLIKRTLCLKTNPKVGWWDEKWYDANDAVLAVQRILNNPNGINPVNPIAYEIFCCNIKMYREIVIATSKKRYETRNALK